MGRQLSKQLTKTRTGITDLGVRARSGYYAAMTDLEKVESNLRRRISRREWSAFRDRSDFERYA